MADIIKVCSVQSCKRPYHARNYCKYHYKKALLKGLPIIQPRIHDFWDAVDKSSGPDSCWIWQRAVLPDGYGIGRRGGSSYRAHRLAWELSIGDVPFGMHVLHKCDNPPCCNPNHLYVGTQKENAADREGRKRGNHAVGERHGRSRLTADDVMHARRMRSEGFNNKEIADQLGFNYHTVEKVTRRVTWRHIS